MLPRCRVALAAEDDFLVNIFGNFQNRIQPLAGIDTAQKRDIAPRLVVGLPVVDLKIVWDHPFVVRALPVFFRAMVMAPRVTFENPHGALNKRGIPNTCFNVNVLGAILQQTGMRVPERMADDVLGLDAFLNGVDELGLEDRMVLGANSRNVAVKRGLISIAD